MHRAEKQSLNAEVCSSAFRDQRGCLQLAAELCASQLLGERLCARVASASVPSHGEVPLFGTSSAVDELQTVVRGAC